MQLVQRTLTVLFGIYAACSAHVAQAQTILGAEHAWDKVVTELIFQSQANIPYEELGRSMPLRPGMDLTPELLEQSIRALAERGIFEDIEVQLRESQGGVAVEFILAAQLSIHEVLFPTGLAIDEGKLRRLASIRRGTPLDIPALHAAKLRLEQGYRDEGYLNANATVAIALRDQVPQVVVTFQVEEGEPTRITRLVLRGTFPAELAEVENNFRKLLAGEVASRSLVKHLVRQLVVRLRNEGYLEARAVLAELTGDKLTGEALLVVEVQPRNPLSISFEGNNSFSAETLLGLLQIESRTVPFSPYAIPNLVREVERFYQERGFLHAQAVLRELPDQDGRRAYLITVNEGAMVRLKQISFVGANAIEEGKLRELLGTAPAGFGFLERWYPGFITSQQLESDLRAIETYYQDRGFAGTKVKYRLEELGEPGFIELRIEISEGELKLLSEVLVVYEDSASEPSAPDGLPPELAELRVGQAFDIDLLERERNRIEDELWNYGYAKAQVALISEVELGKVTYSVRLGPRVQIGRIVSTGNVFTRDHVVLRESQLTEGDYLSTEKVNATVQRLYRLGLFQSVAIEALDGEIDSAAEDLAIRVQERDTGSYTLGVNLNSEDGLNLTGDLTQRNFNGEGNSLILSLDGFIKSGTSFFDGGRARLAFREPYFLNTPVDFSAEAFVQSSIKLLNEFSYNRVGIETGLKHKVLENLAVDISFSPFQEELFDVPEDIIIGENDTGNVFYSQFKSSVTLDERDDVFNPRKGYLSRLEARLASELFGADVSVAGMSWQGSLFSSLSDRWGFGTNFNLSYIVPFDQTASVPLGQRFFLGGRSSLRGFSPSTIGPRGADGNIVGGDTSVVGNLEASYRFTDNVIGVLFFDAGQAVLRHRGSFQGDALSLGLADLRFSPGVGFRYQTPIGPIGIEYGFALERENGEGFGALNFSVGGVF